MVEQPAFTIALTGDSMICRRVMPCQDGPIGDVIRLVQDADVAFTNLEVLPNDFHGHPTVEGGGSHLAAPAWVIDELVAMGFDLFAAATNHSLDYGVEGLLTTIAALEDRQVSFAGIGRTLTDARMPVYHEHGAGTVALIACAASFANGQHAADPRPGLPGRPGLNPLRHDRVYEVTPAQLATLRQIAADLGLERQRQELIALGFGFPPHSPDVYPFLGATFRAADAPSVETSPNPNDLGQIATWVSEARRRADTVIVSIHASEQAGTKEAPASFIRTFARSMIDSGADIIVGHGPHLLRGLEIYRDRPIFYSLGNFFAQNELTYKLPTDSYDHFRVDPASPPGEVYRVRTDDGRKGFPADRRFWETMIPICHVEAGRLRRIELVPISLGHGEPVQRRGRPRLPDDALAASILERVRLLSAPFGPRIDVRGQRAVVTLDGTSG